MKKLLLTFLALSSVVFGATYTVAPDGSGLAAPTNSAFITALGGTTAGKALFELPNPSAITYLRVNADNTVSSLSDTAFRTALGATTVGTNIFTLTNPSAITYLRVNADNTTTAITGATLLSEIGGAASFSTSADLASALSDETGTGFAVFGTSPTITTPIINVTSDATGDTYYRSAGGIYSRLGIGTTGHVLTVAGGLPTWAAIPASEVTLAGAETLTNKTLSTGTTIALTSDATGDIYYNGGTGVLTRLGVGADTNVLTLAAGVPTWGAVPASEVTLAGAETLTNKTLSTGTTIALGTDATGDIYYNGGSGVLTRLGVGADTDVLTLAAGVPTWAAAAGGGLTEFTEALNVAAPNDTVNIASLTPTNGTTNTGVAIQPKGTGSFSLNVPDGTATGGNARGSKAVDLQMKRNIATNVATGETSVIGGGQSNTATGIYATIAGGALNTAGGSGSTISGGSTNNAGGTYAFVGGGYTNDTTTAYGAAIVGGKDHDISSSGNYGFVGGGENNNIFNQYATIAGGRNCSVAGVYGFAGGGLGSTTGSGTSSTVVAGESNVITTASYGTIGGGLGNLLTTAAAAVIPGGRYAASHGIEGSFSFSSGRFQVTGDSQMAIHVQRYRTVDATPAALTSTTGTAGVAATITNTIVLKTNSVCAFDVSVVAHDTTVHDVKAWKITGAVKRGATAADTILLGTPTVTLLGEDAGATTWTVDLKANTTLGTGYIEVTGEAGKTIAWTGTSIVTFLDY